MQEALHVPIAPVVTISPPQDAPLVDPHHPPPTTPILPIDVIPVMAQLQALAEFFHDLQNRSIPPQVAQPIVQERGRAVAHAAIQIGEHPAA